MTLSFRARLIAAMTLAAVLPFAVLLVYIDRTMAQLLVDKITDRQETMVQNVRRRIETDLAQLEREGRFIASLDLMNDVIVGDVDKRILKLITRKRRTLKLDAELSVTDTAGRCIATTQSCPKDDALLRIDTPVRTSFDDRQIGMLTLSMPFPSLAYYLPQQTDSRWSIRRQGRDLVSNGAQIEPSAQNVTLSTPFTLPRLQSYALHVDIQRSALVEVLRDARRQTLAAASVGLLLILATAFYLGRFFARPLGRIAQLMERIVRERRYDLRCGPERTDEIGLLSAGIDTLLQTTQDLIAALDAQSALRLKRFVALTDLFAAISRSKDGAAIDRLAAQCLGEGFVESDPQQRFVGAVTRMVQQQKERLALERTQLRLLEETADALRIKSEFLSQVSHEFRTPLNSIIGFSQFLEQEALVAAPYEALPQKVEKAGKHLLAMINQLLELAQSESARLQRDLGPIDMGEACREVIELLMPLALKSKTTLAFDAPKATCVVHADARMVRQLLFNLIGNAVKFSPEAHVDVSVRCDGDCVTVIRDRGIGMDVKEIAALFTPFTRLSNSAGFKGTGLGLSLAKAYIETLGGTIDARSAGVGKGSTFTVILPGPAKGRNG